MIKKEEAKKLGIKVQEQKDTMGEKNANLIEKLKSLIPNIINSDGTLDIKALKGAIDISHTTSNNQGYELTFAGKGMARWMAGIPTKKELKTEKEESKNFQKTQNVLIRGDNLDILKILYQNYHNKIKMIYIDPPYNTKSDEFIYKDNFKKSEQELIEEYGLNEEKIDFLQNIYGTKTHSGWLAFMYPRLKLARDLLREDGVIFISIDDNEQANLKIMCDEIFGKENVETYIWSLIDFQESSFNKTPSNTTRMEHEYIIACFKQSKKLGRYKEFRLKNKDLSNPDNDPRGDWFSSNISRNGIKSKSGSKYFTIKTPSGKEYTRNWTISKEEYQGLLKDNRIYFANNGNGVPRLKKFQNESFSSIQSSIFTDCKTSITGKVQLKGLFNDLELFSFPKPKELIQRLLNLSTNSNDLILDFFAGSGTTGDAVMQLNAEDGGNRKFILVQWDEKINPKKNKEAHDFCIKNNLPFVISSICLERLNRAGEKIKRENQNKRGMFSSSEELDIGYKVFSLKDKPGIEREDQIFKLKNERQSTLDTLFNMLSATGKPLDTPIQEIQKDVLYGCDGEIYLIAGIDREVIENYRNHKLNIDGYAEIDLESFLNMQVATRENIHIIY